MRCSRPNGWAQKRALDFLSRLSYGVHMATSAVKRRVQTYDLTMTERAAVIRAAKADRRSVSAWVAQAVRLKLADTLIVGGDK